jgi:acetylornithine deacetylase/succinyl-diaminopimelate desuccinylase-like protein
MAIDKNTADRVLQRITEDEVVELALNLGNIDSPSGHEKEVSDYIFQWVQREGFPGRQIALFPERPNVLARYPGTGGGFSLIFNSHMDTSYPEKTDIFLDYKGPHGELAWIDGRRIIGQGVVNDKGPMAAWMIATKAIKDDGVQLPGDIIMSMVMEMGKPPVDEYGPPEYIGKDAGCRYLITRGGIADYALVAETTNFGLGWVEAGESYWKITVKGPGKHRYTPYLQRPFSAEENPNAIVHVARLIDAIEEWAYDYEQRHTYEGPGGKCVPKVNFGAMRSGFPPRKLGNTQSEAFIYLDVRVPPRLNPMVIREELLRVLQRANVRGEVENFFYVRGYEAENVELLRDSIDDAHRALFGKPVGPAPVPNTSMWRDLNCFNECGIPAVTIGPGTGIGGGNASMPIDGLVQSSKLYALTALNLCSQKR